MTLPPDDVSLEQLPESFQQEKDLLSNQPDDCLLRVFSFFDRDTLDTMRQISKKMLTFADKFKDVKRQLKSLSIQRIQAGHIFYARTEGSSGLCHKYYLSLRPGVTEGITELKPEQYDESATQMVEKPGDVRYDERAKVQYRCARSISIPRRFSDTLERFMKTSTLDELRLWSVLIDAPFIERCEQIFGGNVIRLNMENLRLSDEIANDRFVQLLTEINAEETKLIQCNSLVRKQIFARDFLAQFASLRPRQHLHIEQQPPCVAQYDMQFADIDMLRSYSHLVDHSLCLDLPSFFGLVNKQLSEPKASAYWQFRLRGIRRPLRREDFAAGFNEHDISFYDDSVMDPVITFTRDDNDNSARIVYKSFNDNGFFDDYPIVVIRLYNDQP